MNILENLNERLQIVDGNPCRGGEEIVKQVVETSPILLPEDYLKFLKEISGKTDGQEQILGPELGVKKDDGMLSIYIFSAQTALEIHTEYKIYSAPVYDDIIDMIWLIGNDLGDLLYFYGEGKDGYGLYVSEVGALCFEDADKIADTLTDFLVKGIGINTALWIND